MQQFSILVLLVAVSLVSLGSTQARGSLLDAIADAVDENSTSGKNVTDMGNAVTPSPPSAPPGPLPPSTHTKREAGSMEPAVKSDGAEPKPESRPIPKFDKKNLDSDESAHSRPVRSSMRYDRGGYRGGWGGGYGGGYGGRGGYYGGGGGWGGGWGGRPYGGYGFYGPARPYYRQPLVVVG